MSARVFERGEQIGTLAMVETHRGEEIAFLRIWDPAGPAPPLRVPMVELEADWTELDVDGAKILEVGPRSCRRCRRLNFGPCISFTCQDLQVWAGG